LFYREKSHGLCLIYICPMEGLDLKRIQLAYLGNPKEDGVENLTKPCVALVLGSGSARGMAHIGVLQVFQEEGIPVDLVVGCSAGAIAGSLYAAGADLYMLEKLFDTYPVMKQLLDLSLPRTGLVKGDKVLEFLRLLTKDWCFEALPLRLAVTATDIENGTQVVFTEGNIAQAVRASLSIPGIFHPYCYQGMVLVDGGVIERLPVSVAKSMGADYIIGVDVKSGRGVDPNSIFSVMMRSIEIMEEEVYRRTPVDLDIYIQPDVTHIGSFKFDLAGEAVRLGREAAIEQLPEIKRLLQL
jgi:NTE family protein